MKSGKSNEDLMKKQNLLELLNEYKKLLKVYEKSEDSLMAAQTLLKIGEVSENLMNYDEASENYFIALNLFREEKNDIGESKALISFGKLYEKEKEYSDARKFYEQARSIFKKTKNTAMEREVSHLISRCYQAEGSLEDAIEIHQNFNHLPSTVVNEINEKIIIEDLKIKLNKIYPSTKVSLILIIYILALLVAELVNIYFVARWEILILSIIIIFLIFQSSFTRSVRLSYLLGSMILIPLVRIMSLSIPVTEIGPLYWLGILILPTLSACFIVMRNQNLNRGQAGLKKGNLPLQLVVGISGLAIGFIEYLILKPAAITSDLGIAYLIFASIIVIISSGLTEELIYRGIIQKRAENLMGKAWGIIFVSVLFTSQHIGWKSAPYLIFIFGISLIYGYVFHRTRSILGVSLSHGLSNVILFLILPLLVS